MAGTNSAMSVKEDIDSIVKSLQLYHFTTELEHNKKNDSENVRVAKLETILNTLGNSTQTKVTRKDFFSKIDNSVFTYPWRKLPEFHRNIKIKEYINSKFAEKEASTKTQLEKLLLSNGDLNSEKHVIYNSTKMEITDIPVLILDTETNRYKLDLKLIKPKPKLKKQLE